MIKLKKVTKTYKIPHEKRDTLFEILLGYIKDQNRYETFNALEDISFTLNRGETVGIVGRNGSGKTTLLKVIAGIIKPTEGEVLTKVAPFLSLGVGFHDELTAKENLHIYGALFGMKRKEIALKADRIFRFAGVEKFRDTKLKKFSTGMIARLAFSIMVETDPDILLLDEIFAVGDKDFKPKCEEILSKYKKKGKTVLLSSHSLETVKKYCEKTIVLDKGRIVRIGPTREVVKYYEEKV
jgi:lipopolysaccharide transport system ATP-binding protein